MYKKLLQLSIIVILVSDISMAQDDLLDGLEGDLFSEEKSENKESSQQETDSAKDEADTQESLESKLFGSEEQESVTGEGQEPLFVPGNMNQGVYPDISVLTDPLNPFRNADVTTLNQKKWDYVNSDNPRRDFYCWATLLAYQPSGEVQYYTALALKNGRCYEHAIRAFQAIIKYFPEEKAVSEEGYEWSLKEAAVKEIETLGGKPEFEIRKRIELGGGSYEAWFGADNRKMEGKEPWAIGQRHFLELKFNLHPVPFMHGYVTAAIEGARPTDIDAVNANEELQAAMDMGAGSESAQGDYQMGFEQHFGAYVNKVDLQLDTRIIKGRVFKMVPVNNWDDIMDIHPQQWWLAEALGRGWGTPAGIRITEQFIPFQTELTFEGGPNLNGDDLANCFFLRATPVFGPVELLIAHRQMPKLNFNDEKIQSDWQAGAVESLLSVHQQTIQATIAAGPVDIRLQGMWHHYDERAFYKTITTNINVTNSKTNYVHTTNFFHDDMQNTGMPKSYEMIEGAASLRYNRKTSRGYPGLPLEAEINAIISPTWVHNKFEVNATVYAGPLKYFFITGRGMFRKNLTDPLYKHPVVVEKGEREGLTGEIALTFDLTPKTLMRQTWGEYQLTGWEDAPIAVEVGYKIDHYTGWSGPLGREWGTGPYAFGPQPNGQPGLYAGDTGNIYTTVIGNVKNWQFIFSGAWGVKEALRSPAEVIANQGDPDPFPEYQAAALEANYKHQSIFNIEYAHNDWAEFKSEEIPESENEMKGITAEHSVFASYRQAIMDSHVEVSYEFMKVKDWWFLGTGADAEDKAHFVNVKFLLNF
ncbi:MAG TPA: hypothetical protein VKS21_08070 [Spirochaetota bacterium]|nr:hypothetical protein [Spirochaetota bacterium]